MTTRILKPPPGYTELRHCEYIGSCTIYEQFKQQDLRNFWIRLYSKGTRQSECNLKQSREAPDWAHKFYSPTANCCRLHRERSECRSVRSTRSPCVLARPFPPHFWPRPDSFYPPFVHHH